MMTKLIWFLIGVAVGVGIMTGVSAYLVSTM